MIDYFEIKIRNFEQCVEFYRCVLDPLDIEPKWSSESAAGYGQINDDERILFLIEKDSPSSNLHIAFKAANESKVKAFHNVGYKNGYQCNGKPGLRLKYVPGYYAAFLYDPDGNNIEAVYRQ
ncbi:VOC family protein [Zooshikella sp. RANM57]|uniref:VOC family protein n=1 Tax=Zooshikella sp. RANM57 TaxID=3425863 RepID=UPI003D6FDB07